MTTAARWKLVAASLAAHVAALAPAQGQSQQYRSPAGVEYRSQVDSGPIARAMSALAADPRNVERIIQLGVAQSGARQFREAIETFTGGLAIAPNNAMLYRWRGHRYLSVRELDRAMDDLLRGYRLDSTNYGILYHLGIVRFAQGDFAGAAEAFQRAQPRAPDAGELAGSTDWLWMSLSRAGNSAAARAMLDRRLDSAPAGNAYGQRLRLYRGQVGPDQVFTSADTGDVAVATLSYGIGNWHLVRGDTAQAKSWFERSIRSGGWPAFGFIISEIELRRLPDPAHLSLFPPAEIQWKDGPPSLPKGVRMAVLEGDPSQPGVFTIRFKFPNGFRVGPHRHTQTEHATVLSGVLHLGMGERFERGATRALGVGTFGFWPAGTPHFAWFEGETILQLHGQGPWTITYVNPADDPRKAP